MLAETARLQGLVEGLVVLARSDERPHGVREDVDLEDLVQDERQRVRETTSLRVDGTLHPTRVLGNRQELAQVLRNLVDNATHHATGQMTLGVRSEQVDDVPVAVLSVGDDGPGIPPADRERVFERFVRLDPARSRNMGGSGLGLAIVRQLVNDHGGSVEVGVSSLGGALVEVRLPMPEEGQPPSGAMR
jgi:signal transduction histidine kinase